MFKFLRRIFGKDDDSAAPVAARTITPTAVPRVEKAHGAGGVEVASLTLRTILEKLPPELRAIVNQIPDPSVKIVLPVNTIMKQLPTGSVKMSLASLLRQAPQGTFRKGAVEEKQMVDVPLSEIFKSVDPARLGRRSDQRRYDVPDDAAGLFGRNGKTRSVAGGANPDGEMPQAESPEPEAAAPAPAAPRLDPPRVMKMPGIAPASASAPANGNGHGHAPAPAARPAKAQPAPAGGQNCELVISFVELAASWPEGVRSELTMVTGDTKLVIPAPAVSAGLQRGKVVFPWSQVRMWLQPALQGSTSIPDDFDLVFPLKIVAPAFVAATGATKRKEAADIDHSIPDFFGQVQAPAFKLVESKPATEAAPVDGIIPQTLAPAAHAAASAPAPAQSFTIVHEEPVPVTDEAAPLPEPEPEPAPAPSAPSEVVERACGLPGVAGAVIALAEGLVISQRLPEGFSAETFAAFMPQIFSRLEKYTMEMQLGTASVITVETAHGPCRIARLGKVFFGTLGRPGQRLPAALETLTKQLEAHSS